MANQDKDEVQGPRTVITSLKGAGIPPVTSNRALVLAPVKTTRSGSEDLAFTGRTLAELVTKVKPVASYAVEVPPSTASIGGTTSDAANHNVELSIRYGEENAARILDDFQKPALLWKLRHNQAAEGAGLQGRPLLEAAVRNEALGLLLSGMRQRDRREWITDAARREALAIVVREQIQLLKDSLDRRGSAFEEGKA